MATTTATGRRTLFCVDWPDHEAARPFTCRGEVDLATVALFSDALGLAQDDAIAAGTDELVVDLTQLSFLDVLGARRLHAAREELGWLGIRLTGRTSAPVRRTLAGLGLAPIDEPSGC